MPPFGTGTELCSRGFSETIGALDEKLGTGTEAPSVSQQAR